ncbi:hypothetical protein GCM10011344_13890 [Dokdonia pacifica]|uniref:LVIVD repeat-containing protein n=1 Tax=Dokdonia pacifica TaxID=1627892 RepID=A0A238W7E5_9FLAO|nr:hypothetical protein [Dokdonia pacifica]GGG14493.1 hypothetical protein GCM10011344_13890 [Dokdonia pacifica]SNR42331.1 hypothetical protein SAMN06265376_101759 [Dokdonia pacifica]
MRHFIQILQISIIALILIGCSEEDEGTFILDPELDLVLESLTISLDGETGNITTGILPFSDGSESPSLISYPDAIKATRSTLERIDLVFEVESNIEEVYFSIQGASQYYTLTKNDIFVDSGKQAVSILIDIPSSIENDNFCTLISVKDSNQSISNLREICIELKENAVNERVIYFADFDVNSTLSTLNFNTGEVNDIGPIGFSLSDIAFLDDELYGVNLNSDLISIDLDSGQGSIIGNIGISDVNALEGYNGVLYAATRNGEFLTIDPTTAQGNIISLLGSGAVSSGDIVFEPRFDFFYGTLVVPNSPTDELVTIDPITGETSFIGETNYTSVWGLALLRNQLIGLTTFGDFIIIDPNTGEGTFVEITDAFNAGGAAAAIRDQDE